jgi:D-serine deaminase-like pyridoxal phosphate-dependent protein
MDSRYIVSDPSAILSPALLFYKDLIRQNIARAVEMAGRPDRLRPHVKTHKTREIIRLEMAAGIMKHKCATLAEAEMLASCDVPDVFIAYSMVGPNCGRLARLARIYPQCRFLVAMDDPDAVQALSEALTAAGQKVDVLLDLDVGMHRTGIPVGGNAVALYEQIARLPGLAPGGLHVYDGHLHQESLAERKAAVQVHLGSVLRLRSQLLEKGLPVPRLILGGTPTFPVYARMDLPGLELSPGTFFLHDHNYGTWYTDLIAFTPAALLLTRVISRPLPNRLTLDLGYKAVASDPPAGMRCTLLNVPDYEHVLQNEEHLVVDTPAAGCFRLGDVVYAVPAHVCPTCALHRQAYVVEDGRVTGCWDIVARDRVLTI